MTFYIEDWETLKPLIPDVWGDDDDELVTGDSAVTNDVRVVWATLTDWLWHSDGPMVGSKLSRAGLSLRWGRSRSLPWTGSSVSGHGAWPGWGGERARDR